MSEPGWFKSIAPDTALILRQVSREQEWLSRFLSFNSLAPLMVGGAGAAGVGAAALPGAHDRGVDERNGG